VVDAVIQQESGGRAGIQGPQTKWGRAQGLMQVLPSTGQGVAKKLGIAWKPELMTRSDSVGAAYQRQLGEAYLQEGYAKTGNARDALHYYHGGPNRAQWGPKTRGYANSILAKLR